MDISAALYITGKALEYSEEHKFLYLTPETVLLMLCREEIFREAFSACGGSVEQLAADLEAYLEAYVDKGEGKDPVFSLGLTQLFQMAEMQAESSEVEELGIRHLLHAFWQQEESYAAYYLRVQGVEEAELLRRIAELEEIEETEGIEEVEEIEPVSAGFINVSQKPGQRQTKQAKPPKQPKKGERYAPCLNDSLRDAAPLIGREAELERTIQILCRRDKNNPLHIGEPGVGKTAITYGLVQRINEGRVPEQLIGSRVYMLDLGSMLAGTQYRGDFEKRLQKVLREIEKEEKPILYIDEIHNLAGAGAVGEGAFDAANLLKPYFSDGHIRFIGATSFSEYKKHFEKNRGVARRFQNVEINEPSEDETVEILEGLRERYESFHGVRYEDGVFAYAVSMCKKHIHERFLPDKAIDLIDEAGAYRKLHPVSDSDAGAGMPAPQSVGRDAMNEVLSKVCRIPLESVGAEDLASLATLEQRIKERVFGQDDAVAQVVNAVKFSKAGLIEAQKPLASLLFVGPTGVGKTEIALTLAKELGVELLRFDMSEYGERHAIAKLIGSPAGYVGYEEGGLLTEAIRKHPSAVLLLDEIEKAHGDIYNVLLQVMDYATLTDNQGRKADFRNVILIMTSNAGASRLGKQAIGFQAGLQDEGVLDEELRRIFQPEFRNRLDRIVKFRAMDEDMGRRVVGKKIRELGDMLAKRGIRMEADEASCALLQKKGISPAFGAREVDRVIRNELKPLLVDEILFGRLKNGGCLRLAAEGEAFSFSVLPEEEGAG